MDGSRTVRYNAQLEREARARQMGDAAFQLTVFDGDRAPFVVRLSGRNEFIFGRREETPNDREIGVPLESPYISRHCHGRFFRRDGRWYVEDMNSRNGIFVGDVAVSTKELSDGDIIRIDKLASADRNGVLMLFGAASERGGWRCQPVASAPLFIGRDPACQIVLPHSTVSRHHATIARDAGGWTIEDNNSTNGLLLNGVPLSGRRAKIGEKDVITITNSQLVFTSAGVYYFTRARGGISVDAAGLLVRSGRGARTKVRVKNVSLSIQAGELVAFVGGSGAGKSTLLSCVCGYLPPESGSVYVNGLDLYRNYSALNKLIGYVPQSDIVFDSLTLRDMLRYTAKLRLEDLSDDERERAIDEAVRLVQMSDMKDHLIGRMSGGQRKRASIAVELLSNPNLLFLDEPCSGLDPGTERSLMCSLRAMADDGKTVILVTHSTLQLRLCDKVAFVGRGGNLCFFGSFDEALRFFGVDDVVDIYPKLDGEAEQWRDKFAQYRSAPAARTNVTFEASRAKSHQLRQFPVLLARNFRLLLNDRRGLVKQFGQTLILALLMALVADGAQFEQYEATKSLFFILSCVCCWIGLCMAIPEICKERSILRREYMAGLSPTAYILGKFAMLGALCLAHSLIVTLAFALLIGVPESGALMPALMEMLLTSFLIALSSAAMGLALSSASASADKAMKLAPLLLAPQILFSGVVFALDGVADVISRLVVCRWGMEAYGATANLNELPLRLQLAGLPIPHEAEAFFERTAGHMLLAWGALALFTLLLLALTRIILLRLRKEES